MNNPDKTNQGQESKNTHLCWKKGGRTTDNLEEMANFLEKCKS